MSSATATVGKVRHSGKPRARKIGVDDVKDALRMGYADFAAKPSALFFVYLIYPVVALFMARAAFDQEVIPLLFPLSGGIALLGPVVAVGFYEISRRRELGRSIEWRHAREVVWTLNMLSVGVLAVVLFGVFLAWMTVANLLYIYFFGGEAQTSVIEFSRQVFVTADGWKLIISGVAIGWVFASVVMAISAVSFPLLIDQNVGPVTAVLTSIAVALKNPFPVAVWGTIIAASLFFGTIVFFIGLAVVFPILGHATWHFYRKSVEWK